MKIKTGLSILLGSFLFTFLALSAFACYQPVTCNENQHVVDNTCVEDEEEITPTPTPEPEDACAPGKAFIGSYCGWSPQPDNPQQGIQERGNPSCTVSFDAPILQGYSVKNGVQTYSWWNPVTPIDKLSVVYGYAPGQELYGVDNIDPHTTSIDIKGLDQTKTSWLQVWAWKGQCVSKSNWFN